MTDKPISIRIVRPHETDEAWFEDDLETMTRTSLILIGASERPAGTILRFEVTLKNGKPVLRGEGKVVEVRRFKDVDGLVVRFTKLDPKSKQTVDAAHARRTAARAKAQGGQAETVEADRPSEKLETAMEVEPLSTRMEAVPEAPPFNEISRPKPDVAAETPTAQSAKLEPAPTAEPATAAAPADQIAVPEPPPSSVRGSEIPTRQLPQVEQLASAPFTSYEPQANANVTDRFASIRSYARSLDPERVRAILDEGEKLNV